MQATEWRFKRGMVNGMRVCRSRDHGKGKTTLAKIPIGDVLSTCLHSVRTALFKI